MLGSPCSPCCENQRCPQWKVQEFYDLVVSASVSLTLSGTSEERSSFTLAPSVYFGDVDVSNAPAYVYYRTVSPVGTFPLSLVPAETALSDGSAKVVFAMTHQQTLHARLELMVLDLLAGNTQWPGIAGVESPCEVLTDLSVWQDVVTKQYRAIDILGAPTTATQTGLHGQPCTVKYFQPEAALATIDSAFISVISPGVWFSDRSSGKTPIAVRNDVRGYFGTSFGDVFQASGPQPPNTLSIAPQWQGVNFSDMPRFVPANASPLFPEWSAVGEPSFQPGTLPGNIYAPCRWVTSSQGGIGQAFSAGYLGDIASQPADQLFRSSLPTVSYIMPTISLQFA